MSLPDGEYDIDISSLQGKIDSIVDPSRNQNTKGNKENLFQLKFFQYPPNLNADADFNLYPRKSGLNSYLMSSKSTNNGKEMIQEGTGIKSKDTDYVLLLNGTNQKLKLLQMDSTIKINKPRNAKKNASELKELRQESASPQQSYTPTPSSNKWLDYEMQQKNTPIVNTKPEEAEDLNFDDFDQFNDELSFFGDVKAKKLLSSPMGVSPPDVVTPGTQNVSNEKYEDEDVELDSLEDELDQVLGDEDDLEDNHLNFSGFEIDDDPLNSKKDSAANKSNSTANTTKPISLRGLAGEGDDESSSSEEE